MFRVYFTRNMRILCTFSDFVSLRVHIVVYAVRFGFCNCSVLISVGMAKKSGTMKSCTNLKLGSFAKSVQVGKRLKAAAVQAAAVVGSR